MEPPIFSKTKVEELNILLFLLDSSSFWKET